ncbi:tetratricopeptide repeat protein [Enterobacter ludwigii]|uniref:tetratricopeptide repeat protein n=1 Tax=Enterobacter ludwigii TaxID=299767 RepID=UPI0018666495|nr:tetratricopeptide repeat protein [Enterobacter ludwigii]
MRPVPQRRPVNHAAISQQLHSLAEIYRQSMADGDYASASRCCEKALAVLPKNMSVQSDYALSLMRQGKYDQAYKVYRKIYQSPQRHEASETWLDGFAELCGHMGKTQEMRTYGLESLTLSDQRFGHGKCWPLPSTPPRPFDATQREKNIIAFSLFGDRPRYCETLIKNIEAANSLFPGWCCRVYLDNSVPQHVWQRLQAGGAQLVDMSHEKTIYPTLWRFLVMDDPTVERFLVRDADSLLSEREQVCVEAWLRSPWYFHHMRDYFTHTELLLAGMWAGCGGIFPNVARMMREFVVQYRGNARFTDQYFLKAVLWSTVRQSLLSHDDIFGFHHAEPWPVHPPVRWKAEHFHVGSNAGFTIMAGPSHKQDGEKQAVLLKMDGNAWRYTAPVQQGQWKLPMPFFLAEGFRQGDVKVEIVNDDDRQGS